MILEQWSADLEELVQFVCIVATSDRQRSLHTKQILSINKYIV